MYVGSLIFFVRHSAFVLTTFMAVDPVKSSIFAANGGNGIFGLFDRQKDRRGGLEKSGARSVCGAQIAVDQVHPDSFTAQKLFLINPIRRKFPLKETEASKTTRPKVARPVIKPKPKTN